ncbi:MAG: UdgX family uracil-DNA binding protein [Pseudomonadota bacterium]
MDVQLNSPVPVHSFDEWRAAARALLERQVAPEAVRWLTASDVPAVPAAPLLAAPDVRISRTLMHMLQTAACCRTPNRWAFLYRVLWRWQHGERAVLAPQDADGARLRAMVAAVQRELDAMLVGIRFRERRPDAGAPRFVAWCEPGHEVLPQLARHFAARMRRVTWMIATPEASVMWDGATLHSTGALLRGPFPAETGGWLGVFSPARLDAELIDPSAAPPASPDAPATLLACRRCALWQNATQPVPGAGPARARIMLVGEQPGDQEDLAGQPFVGPAGKLLGSALAQAGLERRAIYLTNAVKHFKWEARGKRRMHKTPAQREIEACAYWLERELALVQPRVVVALGNTALKALSGNPRAALKQMLGTPVQHQGRWIVAVYHPAYVLRVPGDEARARAFAVLADGLREAKRLAS